jgi:Xaa-Pro aminopeptidase
MEAVPELLPSGELRVAFEDAHVSVRAHGRLRELVGDRVELVAGGDAVERLRAVKDTDEIRRIGEAAKVADAALRQVMEQGLVGRTELAVAVALERAMEDFGAKRPSFGSIVAAGPQGALPHAQPRDVEIGRDALVVIDWGAELDGYCSDCTRTLATGDLPDATLEAYDLVHQAQLAGLDAVSAGVSGRDADSAARDVIGDAGQAEHFGHGLGHGVGLEIHEAPRLSQRSESVLAAGNVVTVEPGVYLPGQFGVRIEDLVVVTGTACTILTSVPKELITVG